MKKIILLVFGIILFSFFVGFIKNNYSCKLYRNSNSGLQKIIYQKEVENLFLGSSMFRQGIDIYSIEEDFGSNSFILAYNGNQPFSEYYELKYLIDNNVKINNVFFDMYAYSIVAKPKISDSRIFLHTDIKFKKQIFYDLVKYGQGNFSTWWEMFVTANNETLFTYPITNKILNKLYYKGGNIQNNQGITIEKMLASKKPEMEADRINEIQKEYLLKIIQLCKKENINLFFIETPKFITIYEDSDYQNIMMDYIAILEENNMKYFISDYLINEISSYMNSFYSFNSENSEYFLDYVHLSSKGRKEYSQELIFNPCD